MTDQNVPKNFADELSKALAGGLKDEAVTTTEKALEAGVDPLALIQQVVVPTLTKVGQRFEDLEIFLPELMAAGEAGNACSKVIEDALTQSGGKIESKGVIILGTVKGDIHDIGKNLVSMMMEGAGFNVINLGINTDVDAFLAAIREHKPDILGMSAMLTTTMPYMAVVIEALEQEGLRENVLVLVGGAPLNDAFAEEIRADAYCRDAAVGVETAKKLLAIKRGELN